MYYLSSPALLYHPFKSPTFSSEVFLERMASSPFSNPSKPVGRRLYELLEQPQEPFLMEVYLLENRCSGRIMRSQSPLFCWPLNGTDKKFRKFRSHGSIGRSRAVGFMKLVLVNLVYSKAVRKVLHLDMTATAKKRSNIFNFFPLESKDQLSPVSVLELQHSNERSPSDKKSKSNYFSWVSSLLHESYLYIHDASFFFRFAESIKDECPLLSSMDSPRESSITLKETHVKSLFHKKVKFSNRRRLLYDCLREPEERIWSFHGCLNSEMFEQSMNEPSLSWESEKGDVPSSTQIAVASESARFPEEWNHFESGTREIGLCLEAAILDDLKEEAIFDMLKLNFK